MIALLTTIHILAAMVLVFSVLLQSAKGSDVAGAFGGMGSQAAFGPRGTATFLSKATVVLAVVFVITSISLVRIGSDTIGGGDSVLSEESAAAAPATTPPAAPVGQIPLPKATITTEPAAGQPAPQVESVTVNPPPAGGAAAAPAPAQGQ